jgi:hypothetical protein
MSDDCSNRIGIIGDKEVITRLFELVKSEEVDWGKMPLSDSSEEENREWLRLEFDFNKVIPYPQKYQQLDDAYNEAEASGVSSDKLPKSGYEQGGYEWCLKHWGTKWNATNAFTGFGDPIEIKEVEGFTLSDYEKPAYGVIYFVTAYSPAFPVTKVLSKQFPELSFKHSYEEPVWLGSGYQIWRAGILIAEFKDEKWIEVVIDNPVLLDTLQKYKDMGLFDPDWSDFSIGDYEEFKIDSLPSHEAITQNPALSVGFKDILANHSSWRYIIPSRLRDVVASMLQCLEEGVLETNKILFDQMRAEIDEKSVEIEAAFKRVVWKFGEGNGKAIEEFRFEDGQESYT